MSSAPVNPEIGLNIVAAGISTNYHEVGHGDPVLLIHGSGPGVSAWANWRLTMPRLATRFRVIAPDMVGFGFTERPTGVRYDLDTWVGHALGLLDALRIDRAHIVGNSFGGALALALAIRHPQRVRRLVLMGAAGVPFTRASIRPGVQEAFAAMFPAPRQRWVDALASPEEAIRALPHETLIVHGREDRVIPLSNALTLARWIHRSQLHVFGRCGHWTQIEHAERFATLVGDFLAEASADEPRPLDPQEPRMEPLL